MDDKLEITTLGGLDIRRNGVRLGTLTLRKAEALLVYLAVTGKRHPREVLADFLWDDLPQSNSLGNLRTVLSRLRKQVGAFVKITRESAGLDPEAEVWVDVASLERELAPFRAREGQMDLEVAEGIKRAVALYKGAFLEGFFVQDARGFEDWALRERERLHRVVLDALDDLVHYEIQTGVYKSGLAHASLALALDPLMESAHRGMMRLLALSGQRKAALAQFETCKTLLAEELGVAPMGETSALAESIREGTIRPERPTPTAQVPVQETGRPRHNLPAPPNPFIGRVDELTYIVSSLADPGCRLLTLVGTGGMGKTRLALQVAGRSLEGYPAGAWLVELAPLDDETLVPQAAASALGVREQPDRPLTDTIVNALQDRRLLLVVDNCEHLLGAVARLVGTLLEYCPDLTVLATSRERLGISGERLYEVPPMSLPEEEGDPEKLALSDAVRLFCERAAAIQPEFKLDSGVTEDVVQLCRTLDGMPLAIELAAARLRALSVKEISARLDDRFRLLTGGSRTALPRQRTLLATVAWSYDLLTEPERALFDRLSVFRGGFTLGAAEAICGGDGVQEGEVLDLLTSLVEKSLVVASRTPEGTTRYTLLETLRHYGRDRLRSSGRLEEVCPRHAHFYAALAEEAETHIFGPEVRSWCDRLAVEEKNLRAAIHWSLRSDDGETALRMTMGFYTFALTLTHHVSHELDWIQKAIDRYRGDDISLRSKAHIIAGKFTYLTGDVEEAETYLLKSIELARREEDLNLIAFALSWLSEVYRNQRNMELTEKRALESLAVARESGDNRYLNLPLVNLSIVAEVSEAWKLLDEALEIAQELGSPIHLCNTLARIGDLATGIGDLEKAQTAYEEYLLISQDLGITFFETQARVHLAWIIFHKGEYSQAVELLEQARSLSREAGDLLYVAFAIYVESVVAHHRSDYEKAESLCWESLDIFQEVDYRPGTALVLNLLGAIARDQGDYDRAQKLCEESLMINRNSDLSISPESVLSNLASIAHRRGELDRSIELYQEGLKQLGRGERNRILVLFALGGMGCALTSYEAYEEAARLLAFTSRQRKVTGLVLSVPNRPYYERALEIVQQELDGETFAAVWDEGQSMSLEEAFTLALDEVEVGGPADNPGE